MARSRADGDQRLLASLQGARRGARAACRNLEEPVYGEGVQEGRGGANIDDSCSKVLCVPPVSIPFFACELKAVTPYHRGFFCGDPSITYPHLKTESIPDSLLIGGGIAITGLAIALGECYRVRFCDVYSRAFVRNLYVSSLYKELGSFLFGCCVGQSLTNIAKLSVGRLRPHFLSLCNVTYASLNCMLGTYVPSVVCRLTDPREVEEARKSFFSGHASFAMYTMLYLTCGLVFCCLCAHHMTALRVHVPPPPTPMSLAQFYLQARLTWRGARLLRPVLQFLLVLLALYTGLSRVSDYRHHPTDVLAGFLQGALTAYWVVFHISSMFKMSCADLSPITVSLESPLSSQQTWSNRADAFSGALAGSKVRDARHRPAAHSAQSQNTGFLHNEACLRSKPFQPKLQ
ncbi:lipid phosphate phosphohydrolase 3-like, partial [Scleropages formosus]